MPIDQVRHAPAALARYARAYRLSTEHAQLFQMWQAALAHVLLLDHDGDGIHEDQGGLNDRQLAEGACAMARKGEEEGEQAVKTLFSRIEPEIVAARVEEERMEVSIRFINVSFKPLLTAY